MIVVSLMDFQAVMDQAKTKHVVVSGRVQGVGYRAGLRHRAEASRISGWCRNLPDGGVEAVLQGSEEALEVVLFWCHQGPPNARVEALQVTDLEAAEVFPAFEIRR